MPSSTSYNIPTMNNLISVIVPTYNGEKFIAQTLESIINQDYENLEILVVDDVSTDNTVSLARGILENSGRKFQIIQRTVNGHQSASRNTGLEASNGEYVIFFDHDDLAEKNFVSSLVREAEEKNADLVFCGFRYFYKNENRYENDLTLPEYPLGSPENYLRAWADKKINLWSVWNFIFRKNFIIENHLKFPEDIYIGEDVEFIHKAVSRSSNISHINKALYIHVYHASQQSKADLINRMNYKNLAQQYFLAYRRALCCIIKHTSDKFIRNYVISHCFAEQFVNQCTLAAQAGDRVFYDSKTKYFKHKKVRKIMLSTVKFIFKEPELFFKSLMIVYVPNLYYLMRKKRK
ncbi:MAG: glycosyltransferase family 2 protein [Synergistaceae bacterium]|nr:glycosyltransferase family 2 protein [Synergistaceae bacterium]